MSKQQSFFTCSFHRENLLRKGCRMGLQRWHSRGTCRCRFPGQWRLQECYYRPLL